jgi:hypothetical protein
LPDLLLAVATLLAPGLALLAAGLPAGWPVLADGTAILALALAVHLLHGAGGSGPFFVPAVAGLAAALVGAAGATGFGALALAAGSGLGLGLLAGLAERGAAGVRAAGVALLWLALATALPPPAAAGGPVLAETLAAALLSAILLLLLALRAEAGSLAVAARMASLAQSRSAAWGVPVAAVRVALGAIAGLAAGLAAFAWSAATGLGGDWPGTLRTALALFTAAQLSGGTLPGLLAGCFLLLEVPALIALVFPALPLGWLVVAGALLAVGLLGRDWSPLLRRVAPSGPPLAGRGR